MKNFGYDNFNTKIAKKTNGKLFKRAVKLCRQNLTPLLAITAISLWLRVMRPHDKPKAYGIVAQLWGWSLSETKGIFEDSVKIIRDNELKLPDGRVYFNNGQFVGGES